MKRLLVLITCWLAFCSSVVLAQDTEQLDDGHLRRIEKSIRTALAEIDDELSFEYRKSLPNTLVVNYRTRTFMVHGHSKLGEYTEEARETVGPSYRGLQLWLTLEEAGTISAAVVPQKLRQPYWTTDLDIRLLKGTDVQVYCSLSYGTQVDEALLKQVRKFVADLGDAPYGKRESPAVDWNAFDDPAAMLLTDNFATAIADLSASEKAAATKQLLESLKSKEVEIRRRAALTLHYLGDQSGVPTMIEALSTATGRDRDNVVVALRILKDKRAIPALRTALKDESPYVRSVAVEPLGELKAAEAFDEIVLLTKDKEMKRGKEDKMLNCLPLLPATSACYALGALGDQRAIPILIELLDDKELRGPVIQALQVLAKQKFGDDPDKWKSWWNDQSQHGRAQ